MDGCSRLPPLKSNTIYCRVTFSSCKHTYIFLCSLHRFYVSLAPAQETSAVPQSPVLWDMPDTSGPSSEPGLKSKFWPRIPPKHRLMHVIEYIKMVTIVSKAIGKLQASKPKGMGGQPMRPTKLIRGRQLRVRADSDDEIVPIVSGRYVIFEIVR